ncbi:MAG: glycosyl transferase [Deltaproteobacteria bacterium]|nr:glycosyl transferase [Deltaproteobacteria bacterium]MBW2075251.1 glycosyl transferase [Deltaproteobacteria bacterium]RLB81892.1 MAG: glycosyl transferase [Deltaproteobacteria bacterium]
MGEFHQEGSITTIHGFYDLFDLEEHLVRLEKKLEAFSKHMCISLLLPSLYDEVHVPGVLDNIVEQINQVNYLCSIVVALGGAKEEKQFKEAKEYFYNLKKEGRDVKVVWVEGPRIQTIFKKLQEQRIPIGVPGKGQSVWITLGYLFASEVCDVIALHDCDIVTYDRLLLGRLIEPTANPNNDFEFCKGYYARISPTEREMKGRTTRLFVAPFVEALASIMYNRGYSELGQFFSYHRTFRYPLAGEFSFLTRLARAINIAYDWGLEVSTLSEVYTRLTPKKIAQIDLCKNYEHKHQVLSEQDAKKGLHRMVVDIAKFYLNCIRSHGMPIDDAFIDMLQHTYYSKALSFVKSYSDDAESNDLVYDRHQEELTVRYFRDFIATAWAQARGEKEGTQIPSWNRVIYSAPDIYDNLLEAVEKDNE